ncbi:MAG: tetratricopeptide repeat protein [Nitrospira sp.]|nr:tetratricopeptide repeat protein [Nitrospira sp.]
MSDVAYLRALLPTLIIIGVLFFGGCSNHNAMLAKEISVPQDKVQAAALLRKGCDGGQPNDCFKLGAMFDIGKGVPQDIVQAAALYRKACDGGVAESCFNLGVSYENGYGVISGVRS